MTAKYNTETALQPRKLKQHKKYRHKDEEMKGSHENEHLLPHPGQIGLQTNIFGPRSYFSAQS